MSENVFDIGKKIKELRLKKGLTLKQVAKETGFSPALISQIENNNISPPIATLAKLASFFDVKIGYFFEEDGLEVKYSICRKGQGKKVERVISKSGKKHGYTYEALSADFKNKKMEPFILRLDRNLKDEESLYSHEGEEFLMVLKGNVIVAIEKERLELKEGDSIYFDSSARHRLLNPYDKEAYVLAVILRQ
jgi:transcriptional regulator with XRE-family HTH domain